MGDLEQMAIDALRAAGLESEAHAVESLRANQQATMAAYHAGQRSSYEDGRKTERDRLLCALRQMHTEAGGMHNYYLFAVRQLERDPSRP